MGTAREGEGKCAGLLVSELSLACSVFLQKIVYIYFSSAQKHRLNERRSDGGLSRTPADPGLRTYDWAQRTLEDEVRKGTTRARVRVRCDCARHRRLPCLAAESRAHSTAHLTRLCQGIWKLASYFHMGASAAKPPTGAAEPSLTFPAPAGYLPLPRLRPHDQFSDHEASDSPSAARRLMATPLT
jgi:hypothetical protein